MSEWSAGLIADFSEATVGSAWPPIAERIRNAVLRKHPLGFLHATLAQENGYALRFHIWPWRERFAQEPAWTVHTHTFELRSTVLVGSLWNSSFEFDETTSSPKQRLYRTAYDDKGSVLIATERYGTLTVLHRECVQRGGFYNVAHGAFHETMVDEDELTATLALTLEKGGMAWVAGEMQGRREYKYSRSPWNKDSSHSLITDVLSRIQCLGFWDQKSMNPENAHPEGMRTCRD